MLLNTVLKQLQVTKFYLPALVFTMSILLQPNQLQAQEATITDLTVSNSETQLLLYLSVHDCFTEEMETAIHNGIPATFTFYVELYQRRKAWPDQKVSSKNFNHVMEYDSLKKEYQVHRDERKGRKLTSSLLEAKTLMSEINGYEFFPLAELDANSEYVVKVKAKLAKKTLPLYFHYLIPFSSLWDFETNWYELVFHL